MNFEDVLEILVHYGILIRGYTVLGVEYPMDLYLNLNGSMIFIWRIFFSSLKLGILLCNFFIYIYRPAGPVLSFKIRFSFIYTKSSYSSGQSFHFSSFPSIFFRFQKDLLQSSWRIFWTESLFDALTCWLIFFVHKKTQVFLSIRHK